MAHCIIYACIDIDKQSSYVRAYFQHLCGQTTKLDTLPPFFYYELLFLYSPCDGVDSET